MYDIYLKEKIVKKFGFGVSSIFCLLICKGTIYLLQIAEFFILNHVSYVLSRRLNLTQLISESLDPELYYQNALRDISLARDVSYLPEKYYNAENGVNKLQQLDRDNRNLITVSNYFLIPKINHSSLRKTLRNLDILKERLEIKLQRKLYVIPFNSSIFYMFVSNLNLSSYMLHHILR